jgi:hypothetical protein
MKRHLLRRFGDRQPWPRASTSRRRPALEPLEARDLLDGGLANVLVNNPAWDNTAPPGQDTQSETAITLGAGSKIVVAYNDSIGTVRGDNYHGTGYSFSGNAGAKFEEQDSVVPIFSIAFTIL